MVSWIGSASPAPTSSRSTTSPATSGRASPSPTRLSPTPERSVTSTASAWAAVPGAHPHDLGRLVEAEDNAVEAIRIQQDLGNPEDVLSAQVVLVRALLARGEVDAADGLLDDAFEAVAAYDSEGFEPLLHAWRARILVRREGPEAARDALVRARKAPGRMWPHQRVRLLLNLARAHEALGEPDQALKLAEEGLQVADSSGYRFYAMRARRSARATPRRTAAARHSRVGTPWRAASPPTSTGRMPRPSGRRAWSPASGAGPADRGQSAGRAGRVGDGHSPRPRGRSVPCDALGARAPGPAGLLSLPVYRHLEGRGRGSEESWKTPPATDMASVRSVRMVPSLASMDQKCPPVPPWPRTRQRGWPRRSPG